MEYAFLADIATLFEVCKNLAIIILFLIFAGHTGLFVALMQPVQGAATPPFPNLTLRGRWVILS